LSATTTAQERRVGSTAAVPSNTDVDALVKEVSEYVSLDCRSWYKSLSPKIEKEQTAILAGLKASTVEIICDKPRVRAIRLGNGATLDTSMLAGDTIYERDFYPQLVRDIRTARLRVLLLGNSGVGKSMFQYYLLARYMNPAHFQDIGSAPPTRRIRFGSAAPPKVVIRHLPDKFHVLFLEKGVAHRVTSPEVLECFDPATTLYFFEPDVTTNVGPIRGTLQLPTLATMSPNIERYKEFQKKAATMYCPVYTGKELLAIGRDMRQPARGFPDDLLDLYSDANISERFDDFNGIFRYVLPETEEEADKARDDRIKYLKTSSTELIDVNMSTLVQRVAGTFALLYKVGRRANGEWDFFSEAFMYAGPHVSKLVQVAYASKTIKDLQRRLQDVDEGTVKYSALVPDLFEVLVAKLLTEPSGVRWELRAHDKKVTPKPKTRLLKAKLDGLIEGKPPVFAKMVANKLYRPDKQNFPLCDMMYKDSKGTLVCVQVSWTKDRIVETGPFLKFCEAMGLCATDSEQLSEAEEEQIKRTVHFVFCPRPSLFLKSTLGFETGCVLQKGDILRMGEGFTSEVVGNAS
jgi:hypothetical protein